MNDSPQRKRLLVIGATGYIASLILPGLRERFDLRLVDVKNTTRDGDTVPDVVIANILEAGEADLVALFTGVDAVVHMGFVRPREGHEYEDQRRNVDMTQRIFELAVRCGVPRVVAASTNQAAKWYEEPYRAGRLDRVTPEDYPRSVSYYGWAKAAYEALGFLHASGGLGYKLEIIMIRIVAPREIEADEFRDRPAIDYVRDLAGYISPRDLQQLFVKSIETPDINDEEGIPFHIFYGVSNNARTFWSITNARKVIGYAPDDDSEQRFAADIAALLGSRDEPEGTR